MLRKTILNDEMAADQFDEFLRDVFQNYSRNGR
ncbi:DNA (cytosine-5-)-methyltransferase [Bacillus licheniformis]|jgi:hypothetical protein|nr:hypothetical protein [Bacillus licheniformis]APJ27264.1 DNA (cytosine-5-)-methyltransferase [Bacillus sp. H15-1]ASV15663.1 DNA (cytosine-5-)-methyltransferase [Bacillus sp. 1s-1]KUL09036.1 hypothetical protein LI17339_15995 [Bacillus licheniformis LMG 17339]MBY8346810.1 DNA (cytosine-5-)-methyltransferase [Bacillus sp. PCH94]MDP4122403.1 DNA (cytosine-5-)-methyltransferase [Bacillota bacterium]NBB44991.1 DNA (cytosine-5-)-methyltransferase [Bacillus sp. y1(2019)]